MHITIITHSSVMIPKHVMCKLQTLNVTVEGSAEQFIERKDNL